MPLFLVYVPVAYFSLKNAGFFLHAAVAVFLAALGRSAGFGSIEFLIYALNGVVFGYAFAYAFKRQLPLFYVILLPLCTQVVFMMLCDWVPAYSHAYRDLIQSSIALTEKLMGKPQNAAFLEELQRNVLLPVSGLFSTMLSALVLALLFYRTAGRSKPRISDFEPSYWLVWVFAAGLALFLLKVGGSAGLYITATAVLCYGLSGIAITRLFFDKMSRSRLGEFFFYAMQVPLVFTPVLAIGLMENWWDFRARISTLATDNGDGTGNKNE